jgi:hypothetical protein
MNPFAILEQRIRDLEYQLSLRLEEVEHLASQRDQLQARNSELVEQRRLSQRWSARYKKYIRNMRPNSLDVYE